MPSTAAPAKCWWGLGFQVFVSCRHTCCGLVFGDVGLRLRPPPPTPPLWGLRLRVLSLPSGFGVPPPPSAMWWWVWSLGFLEGLTVQGYIGVSGRSVYGFRMCGFLSLRVRGRAILVGLLGHEKDARLQKVTTITRMAKLRDIRGCHVRAGGGVQRNPPSNNSSNNDTRPA